VSTIHLAGKPGAVLVAAATYALALSAAKLTGSDIGGINARLEAVSSGAGSVLGGLGTLLPIGYAFAAGMVAAVNPCGFALLPAYVALYLGRGDRHESSATGAERLVRAARIGLAMTAGFAILFATAGLLLGAAATAVVRLFPWVGLAIGVALVALGARVVSGPTLYASVGERLADRLSGRARRTGSRSYFVYGLAYGLASLSCTLPIFLAIVASAFTAGDYVAAITQFLLYALGMGTVIIAVTVGVAVFGDAMAMKGRMAMRYVEPATAVLLLLAGAYIIYYWLTLGGLLAAVHLA
jgi:cytochrome c-type biogenesis protein